MRERRNQHEREKFILNNINPDRQNDLLYIEQAGITHPDPAYFIRRTRSLRCFDYLYVLEYVVSGKGYIECGGQTYTVQAGDFYFLNRGIEPCYYADPDKPFAKLWINIAGGFMNLMTASYQLTMPVLVCHFGEDPGVGRIHEILLRTDSLEACTPDVMRALIDLFERIRENRIAQASGESLFADICKKIEQELCFSLSIDQLARDFYISRSTLYRLFMANCGLSPKQYILSRKIELAKLLLTRNVQSIEELASILQFADAKHFGRVFRAQVGVSPASYRFGLAEDIGAGNDPHPGRTLLWQYSTIESRSDAPFTGQSIGMGYVLRTAGGRFIVVDGGLERDAGPLISLMQRESGQSRPEVALWLVTHPHVDHIGALLRMAGEPYLKRQIRIDTLAFSLPKRFISRSVSQVGNQLTALHAIPAAIGCRYICPRRGERLAVDELTVEILLTHEDHPSETFNDLSMIFRISGGKKSVIFTGDATPYVLQAAAQTCTAEQLHSDIIQAAHHGLDGGNDAFYRMVGAETVLAPMSRAAYAVFTAGDAADDSTQPNRGLMLRAKVLHLAGDGDVCIPLDEA